MRHHHPSACRMLIASVTRRVVLVFAFAAMATSWVAPVRGCTSACLAQQGHVVFGNNLDWYIDDGLLVVNKRNVKKRGAPWVPHPPAWISKYGSITTNLFGVGFTNRGMNEKGLVIGEMTLSDTTYPSRDARRALIQAQWIQYQLDNCATVEEVLATDTVIRIDTYEYPSHFLVCDSSGACATVEWLGGQLVAHRGPDAPVKALTNSPYSECLSYGSAVSQRFATAANLLEQYAGEDPIDYMFSILNATHQQSTVWRLVFDVKNLRLYYLTARNRARRWVSLTDFNLSCSTAPETLDINASGIGDVRAAFRPFDHQVNESAIRNFFTKWAAANGPVPESFLQQVITYHDTMRCCRDCERGREVRPGRD